MKNLAACMTIALFSLTSANAQLKYDSVVDLHITIGGQLIPNTSSGGFSNPRMQAIDLDNDGYKDMIVFDPPSYPGRLMAFRNTKSTGSQNLSLEYAPEFQKYLPEVEDYVLVRDMNCDGVDDIIDRGFSGTRIHYGAYDADGNWYSTHYFEPQYKKPNLIDSGNIYVAPNGDIPLIADMDGDGDIDILAFDVLFPGLTFYKNYQDEYELSCDSNFYIYETLCYQHLRRRDSIWSTDFVCKTDGSGKTTHTMGVTMEAIDMDGDGDLDILSGSSTTQFINVLYNTGTAASPIFNTQDTFLRSTNGTMGLVDDYAVVNILDYNNDKTPDFVLTNNNYGTDDVNQFRAMKNTSSTHVNMVDDPGNFFEHFTLDFGSDSHPVLHDQDGDGDLDLIVSVGERTANGVVTPSRVVYLENYGTPTSPMFRMKNDDYLQLSTSSYLNLVPSFGDIDNDGDDDLLLGHKDGFIIYENTVPSPALPPIYAAPVLSFPALDSAELTYPSRDFSYLAPVFYDLDDDGDQDILCGEKYGNLLYFKNAGTADTIHYEISTTLLGLIDVSGDGDPFYAPGAWEGFSTPSIGIIDSTDSARLLIGCYDGYIYSYDLGDELSSFTLRDSFITGRDFIRAYSAPTVGDLFGTPEKVIITGTSHGGLQTFTGNYEDTTIGIHTLDNLGLELYPNPTTGRVFVKSENPNMRYRYSLYNVLGAIISRGEVQQGYIDLPILPQHSYLLYLENEDGEFATQKLLGK